MATRQLLIKGVNEEVFASIEKVKNKITEKIIEKSILLKKELNKKEYKITQNDICLCTLELVLNNEALKSMIESEIEKKLLAE
jgi:hypothetical protein